MENTKAENLAKLIDQMDEEAQNEMLLFMTGYLLGVKSREKGGE